ncbi:TPA: hypothetical protein ACOEHG_005209 [Enterobacter ludwigii]
MTGFGFGVWWVVIITLSAGQAHAAERYCRADIFMGRVTSVQGDAQAQRFPVRQEDGTYRRCDVFMGRVSGCQGLAEARGFPVQQPDGSYRDCEIFMGRVSGCGGEARRSGFPVACD